MVGQKQLQRSSLQLEQKFLGDGRYWDTCPWGAEGAPLTALCTQCTSQCIVLFNSNNLECLNDILFERKGQVNSAFLTVTPGLWWHKVAGEQPSYQDSTGVVSATFAAPGCDLQQGAWAGAAHRYNQLPCNSETSAQMTLFEEFSHFCFDEDQSNVESDQPVTEPKSTAPVPYQALMLSPNWFHDRDQDTTHRPIDILKYQSDLYFFEGDYARAHDCVIQLVMDKATPNVLWKDAAEQAVLALIYDRRYLYPCRTCACLRCMQCAPFPLACVLCSMSGPPLFST